MSQINITLNNSSNKEQSNIQNNINNEIEFEDNISNNIENSNNTKIEEIWKSFLDNNQELFIKLSNLGKLPENANYAGATLIANGMYEEAKLWKDYRRKELEKLNIKVGD